MKQIAAILLMSLLLFNIAGYRFTLHWMQQAQNHNLEQQLDAADYDEASLVEITVPLSLPYYNNWGEWERYDGEVQLAGLTYKYVKRKVEGGNLVLKCLPNPQQQIIQKNVSSAFAQLNGLPTDEPASKAFKKTMKAVHVEYEEITLPATKNSGTVVVQKSWLTQPAFSLQTICAAPWQPPKFIS